MHMDGFLRKEHFSARSPAPRAPVPPNLFYGTPAPQPSTFSHLLSSSSEREERKEWETGTSRGAPNSRTELSLTGERFWRKVAGALRARCTYSPDRGRGAPATTCPSLESPTSTETVHNDVTIDCESRSANGTHAVPFVPKRSGESSVAGNATTSEPQGNASLTEEPERGTEAGLAAFPRYPVRVFRKQDAALAALQALPEELKSLFGLFAQEIAEKGVRRYIVASYRDFAGGYLKMVKTQEPNRHLYEVLREGRPCWLYFDVEFSKSLNPDINGEEAIALLKQMLAKFLSGHFGFPLQNSDIVDLDSSTTEKFSRHLIVKAVLDSVENSEDRSDVQSKRLALWLVKEPTGVSEGLAEDQEGREDSESASSNESEDEGMDDRAPASALCMRGDGGGANSPPSLSPKGDTHQPGPEARQLSTDAALQVFFGSRTSEGPPPDTEDEAPARSLPSCPVASTAASADLSSHSPRSSRSDPPPPSAAASAPAVMSLSPSSAVRGGDLCTRRGADLAPRSPSQERHLKERRTSDGEDADTEEENRRDGVEPKARRGSEKPRRKSSGFPATSHAPPDSEAVGAEASHSADAHVDAEFFALFDSTPIVSVAAGGDVCAAVHSRAAPTPPPSTAFADAPHAGRFVDRFLSFLLHELLRARRRAPRPRSEGRSLPLEAAKAELSSWTPTPRETEWPGPSAADEETEGRGDPTAHLRGSAPASEAAAGAPSESRDGSMRGNGRQSAREAASPEQEEARVYRSGEGGGTEEVASANTVVKAQGKSTPADRYGGNLPSQAPEAHELAAADAKEGDFAPSFNSFLCLFPRISAEGERSSIIDVSVYSRNRCFRLLHSSKFNKAAFLQVSPANAFPLGDDARATLLRSLASLVPPSLPLFDRGEETSAAAEGRERRGCSSSQLWQPDSCALWSGASSASPLAFRPSSSLDESSLDDSSAPVGAASATGGALPPLVFSRLLTTRCLGASLPANLRVARGGCESDREQIRKAKGERRPCYLGALIRHAVQVWDEKLAVYRRLSQEARERAKRGGGAAERPATETDQHAVASTRFSTDAPFTLKPPFGSDRTDGGLASLRGFTGKRKRDGGGEAAGERKTRSWEFSGSDIAELLLEREFASGHSEPAEIASCLFFTSTQTAVITLKGNRFCERIGRPHKSNAVSLVLQAEKGCFYQKCYDPDCRGFRSALAEFPAHLRGLQASLEELADLDIDSAAAHEAASARGDGEERLEERETRAREKAREETDNNAARIAALAENGDATRRKGGGDKDMPGGHEETKNVVAAAARGVCRAEDSATKEGREKSHEGAAERKEDEKTRGCRDAANKPDTDLDDILAAVPI